MRVASSHMCTVCGIKRHVRDKWRGMYSEVRGWIDIQVSGQPQTVRAGKVVWPTGRTTSNESQKRQWLKHYVLVNLDKCWTGVTLVDNTWVLLQKTKISRKRHVSVEKIIRPRVSLQPVSGVKYIFKKTKEFKRTNYNMRGCQRQPKTHKKNKKTKQVYFNSFLHIHKVLFG